MVAGLGIILMLLSRCSLCGCVVAWTILAGGESGDYVRRVAVNHRRRTRKGREGRYERAKYKFPALPGFCQQQDSDPAVTGEGNGYDIIDMNSKDDGPCVSLAAVDTLFTREHN
jgi:hypothetical protein